MKCMLVCICLIISTKQWVQSKLVAAKFIFVCWVIDCIIIHHSIHHPSIRRPPLYSRRSPYLPPSILPPSCSDCLVDRPTLMLQATRSPTPLLCLWPTWSHWWPSPLLAMSSPPRCCRYIVLLVLGRLSYLFMLATTTIYCSNCFIVSHLVWTSIIVSRLVWTHEQSVFFLIVLITVSCK
jgi:hypothetical protein